MIFPDALKKGDKIAILSPASSIDASLVDGACNVLCGWGFSPYVSAHCKGANGTYSGSVKERLNDVVEAFSDPSIRAVMCSRGGYGMVQLLEHIPVQLLKDNPKWVMGYSDITAWHATMVNAGIVSIHSAMCKHLCELGGDDICSGYIRDMLMGDMPEYTVAVHELNRQGKCNGMLVGGNMAVMCGLISTPFDLLKRDVVLFIEDISEPVYKIERMLYNLRLSGVLANIKGLIVGQFTEYKSDMNNESMYEMIYRMVSGYDYPVAFNFPVGHVDSNLPMLEGANVYFVVEDDAVRLSFGK